MSKQALGKGLSALIDDDVSQNNDTISTENKNLIPINSLIPNRFQPRITFNEEAIKELAESIKKNGILQPILVRTTKNTQGYEIIAGERRFRAAKLVGLEQVPVIVKEISDQEALEIALIENIQREDLSPIEEALAYKSLQVEFNYKQEDLSKIMGKSRSHITNSLRLLTLPDSVQDLIDKRIISASHARALIGTSNPEILARQIIDQGLNVRETEKLAVGHGHAGGGAKGKKTNTLNQASPQHRSQDDDLLALEQNLSEKMGLKVTIEDSSEGGRVILYFNNLTELDKIMQKMSS